MIRLRHWPLLCLLGLALAAPADRAKAQDGNGGYYASAIGMFLLPLDSEWSEDIAGIEFTSDLGTENGVGVLGALGYSLDIGLRGEVELGYRRFGLDELEGDEVDGMFDTVSLMTNGFYDFDLGRLRPYVGGGVGAARHELDIDLPQSRETGATMVLAYQAMSGLGYSVSDSIDIHLGYRYFGTTAGDFGVPSVTYGTHSFEAGIRFRY